MNLATDLAQRSHCVKAQVGAVLTKDTRIISIGYNGPISLPLLRPTHFFFGD